MVVICPGDIATDMADLGMELGAQQSGLDPSTQESLAPLETIALRRRGEAVEVGRVVAWLASSGASYISGEPPFARQKESCVIRLHTPTKSERDSNATDPR